MSKQDIMYAKLLIFVSFTLINNKQGVLERFFDNSDAGPVGCDVLVWGTVPAGSGLSSSAAMVVASTLAFLTVNHKVSELSKGDLVGVSMENEKRVGKYHWNFLP